MFQGLRERRGREEEAAGASAAANVLQKRQLRQAAQQEDQVTPAQPAPREATVSAQIAAARQAFAQRPSREAAAEPPGQTLTVGPGIQLKGEITNCDTLVVEGHVEGSAKSGTLQISEGGAFLGDAEIDTAVISGRFDGSLVAAARLVIRASGRVSGTIRYAAIAIEAGGQISGDVQVSPAEPAAAAKPAEASAEATKSQPAAGERMGMAS